MRNQRCYKRILFAKGGRTAENIPPTLDALKQHIRRSAFQVIKSRQCLIIDPFSSFTDPGQWDWQETDSGYFPVWTTLPEASKACRILLKCGCKKYCKGTTNEIVCTKVCASLGNCTNGQKMLVKIIKRTAMIDVF